MAPVNQLKREKAQANIRRWREQPIAFAREVLGAAPDVWQDEVLEAMARNQKIALKACKGPGKTCLMAWGAWWFLTCHPEPNCLAISITGDNLHDGLWKEMAKWQNRSQMLQAAFQWTSSRIFLKERPETWWMSARSWSRDADSSQQANTLAGLHGEYTLAIVDEVGDIPAGVVASADASLSGGTRNLLWMAGNPTRTDGPLWDACTRERSSWYVKEITGDPDAPDRAPRVDVKWARSVIDRWGADSNVALVNVFGKFPKTQSDKMLGPDDVQSAMARYCAPGELYNAPRIISCDVARTGDDRSVIVCRQGRMVMRPEIFRELRSDELGDMVLRVADRWVQQDPEKRPVDAIFIDESGGYGGGVIDHCRRHNFSVRGVFFGGKAFEPERFKNKRAEMYWTMAEWIKTSGCLPNEPDMARELTHIPYFFDGRQRVQIPDKDEIKKAIGCSPDISDALALTFAAPVAPRISITAYQPQGAAGGRCITEDDVSRERY
jgi:hypothetical protein